MTSQERIRLARRMAGLSQTQLAKIAGVQRSAVSHWESPLGKHPSVDHLRAIAMATNTPFEWLATGRGSMALPAEEQPSDQVVVQLGDVQERRLIAAWRSASPRARVAMLELLEEMAGRRSRGGRRAASAES